MTNTMQQNRTTYSPDELDQRSRFDRSRPLERDESHNLISSARVEGTKVFSTEGDQIGKIDHVMIGKRSGRVEYSVVSYGGFLGMGESHYPVPWEALDYDTEKGGYVVNIEMDKLEGAPSYQLDETPTYDDQYGRQVFSYYGVLY